MPQSVWRSALVQAGLAEIFFQHARDTTGAQATTKPIDKHGGILAMRLRMDVPPLVEPGADGLHGVRSERRQSLPFPFSLNPNQTVVQIEVSVVDRHQFTNAESARVHGLQHRPVSRTENLILRGGVKQLLYLLGRQEVGQFSVGTGIAQGLGGVVRDKSFPLRKTKKTAG